MINRIAVAALGLALVSSAAASTLDASLSGLTLGTASNIFVSSSPCCATEFPLAGTFTGTTGGALFPFTVTANTVSAAFFGGEPPPDLMIVDPSNHLLVEGIMEEQLLPETGLVSFYPNGTGNFTSGVFITYVSPTVLGLFHENGFAHPGFVEVNFDDANLVGTNHLEADITGATVAITPTPEPVSLFLLGFGILAVSLRTRRNG